MGNITFQHTPGWTDTIPLESVQCFSFRKSVQYARQFQRFAGAIVPTACRFDPRYGVVNVDVPVNVDLSRCGKVGWTAKRDSDSQLLTPDMLEIFLVATFFETIPDDRPVLIRGIPRCGDIERAHILFPGSWATLVWDKSVCIWYRQTQLLRGNPRFPTGLLPVRHQNLTDVFAGLLTHVKILTT